MEYSRKKKLAWIAMFQDDRLLTDIIDEKVSYVDHKEDHNQDWSAYGQEGRNRYELGRIDETYNGPEMVFM